jgi:hypothetical protein
MSQSEFPPIAIRWPAGSGSAAQAMPISFGVNLPRGAVREPGAVQVVMPDGRRLAAQGTALGHWQDGSVRWLQVDCVVPAGTELAGCWHVAFSVESVPMDAPTVQVRQAVDSIELANGDWILAFDKRSGAWQVLSEGEACARAALPAIIDSQGRTHAPLVQRVELVAAGPIWSAVEITAEYRRLRGLRLVSRWCMFAGTGWLRGDVTLHNPRRARHRSGLWDLGDLGSVLFKDFTQMVTLTGSVAASARYRVEPALPLASTSARVEIYQESSGGENWNSRNHLNRNSEVTLRFRGYQGAASDQGLTGLRAQPVVEVSSDRLAIAAAIEGFWQQFPKALECEGGEVRLRLFPQQSADLHELQGGEQKTHRLLLQVSNTSQAEASRSRNDSQACSFPARKQPQSLAPDAIPGLPDWTLADSEILTRLDRLTEEFLTGPCGLYANRERVDEYGWRNFGDLHADHEEQHYHGRQPLVSHYNNQFDVLCGFLLQYFRTADQRWMELAHPLARHVIDIDIYHTAEDRPAYCGGLFWFTDHYLHAETSSHRTYSRHNAPAQGYGGGPAASHNFTTGLLLYHLLTGDPQARQAVITLADWVLAQDDGSRTILGLVDDGPTGMASATSHGFDHGPGRAAGNSINGLLDGWLLTGEPRYLAYAETLIQRCVHPAQDIASLDLLNAEQHWSYTVFLVSLEKYILCKDSAGQIDAQHAYAQSCLLHYGRWMLGHERPYFDRAEELEYPTEAWAAQEFRKANALRLAARHAEPSLAERMLNRGDELAERAWRDLLEFETRTTARAMAVVLVEGLRDAQLRCRNISTSEAPEPLVSLPPHRPFLPQRERIKQQLRSPAGVASLLAIAANPARWPRLMNHR